MEHYQIISTWDDEEKYEYDMYVEETDQGTTYSMYCSNNETWSTNIQGSLVQQVTDTGDEYKFKHSIGKKSLDYNQAADLYILMSFINKVHLMYKGRIYHVKKIGEL